MIEIRPLALQELPQLRELAIKTYRDTFAASTSEKDLIGFFNEAYTLPQFEKEYYEQAAQYLLAWEGDTLVGFLRWRLSNEVEQYLGKNTLEVHRLYVHTHHKGKKIGSALMTAALDYATEKKFEWIWLGVWERNFSAQAFYKSYGFEKFSQHVFLVGDDPQIDWLLKKKLG
jgi:diamine N-acetyltransferase